MTLMASQSLFSRPLQLLADHWRQASNAFQQDPPVTLERYLAFLRFGVMLGTLGFVPFLPGESAIPICTIVAFAGAYTCTILWIIIPRYPNLLRRGFLVCTLETISLAMIVAFTGGWHSPFFVAYYAIAALYALRFGLNQIIFSTLAAGLTYTGAILLSGTTADTDWGLVAFRVTWLFIVSLVAGIVSARAEHAEASLATELQRTKGLLQAAHAPAASLTLDGVLNAILEQSKILTGADLVAIQLVGQQGHQRIFRAITDSRDDSGAFERLVRGNSAARRHLVSAFHPVSTSDLVRLSPNLGFAVADPSTMCAATIPGHRGAMGFIAVARRGLPALTDVQQETLSAFAQRAALAIQNARLYEQQQTQMEELRSLHDQIVRSERLSALGQLAAKVAHELNNPLTAVHMYSSLLQEEPVEYEEQKRLATSMIEQVNRARQVVRDILDYSRPSEPHTVTTTVSAMVEYGLRLARHAANAGRVAIIEDYAGNLPPVQVDLGQMAQVFTNLVMNAIHSMPEGGVLVVTTGSRGENTYVRFQDNGCGIPPEALRRIFEPFFTTKVAGEGTGLGLAVCQGLVERHNGQITVESEVGKGSAFTVWLPPAEAKEAMVGGSTLG